MKTDALNRRSRFAGPQPLGGVVLHERDMLIFEAIDRHGKLPTPYILALTEEASKSYKHLQVRLTQLFNEGYLSRDPAQFNNFQARYQPMVYGLTEKAKRILGERALRYSPEHNDPFVHQFFGACFSASFELSEPHRFISREEIITHVRCPESTRLESNPFAIPVNENDITAIIPDNLFGIEYEGGGFRFFAVEIDRNTESVNPRKQVRNSISKKLRGYSRILDERTFNTRFGLPNLTVLVATTNATHAENMIAEVKRSVDTRHHGKFLFKAFQDFGENWRVPRTMLPVFEPWRSAKGDVEINKKAAG
jgi:hypothetical protein